MSTNSAPKSDQFFIELRDLLLKHYPLTDVKADAADDTTPVAKRAKQSNGSDDTPEMAKRRAELLKTDLRRVKSLAKQIGFDPDDVKTATREVLVNAILREEFNEGGEEDDDTAVEDQEVEETEVDDDEDVADEEDDEEDEDEADEEDDDSEEEGDVLTRKDLDEMSPRELRGVAKDAGYTADDLKGKDSDTIIDMLLGEGVFADEGATDDEDEDEEDAEEVEEETDEADDDDEGDEDEDYYTEDDLNAMSIVELKALAKEYGYGVKDYKGMKKPALVKLLMETDEESA